MRRDRFALRRCRPTSANRLRPESRTASDATRRSTQWSSGWTSTRSSLMSAPAQLRPASPWSPDQHVPEPISRIGRPPPGGSAPNSAPMSAAPSEPLASCALADRAGCEVDRPDRAVRDDGAPTAPVASLPGCDRAVGDLRLGDRAVRCRPQVAHGAPAEVARLERAILDHPAVDVPLAEQALRLGGTAERDEEREQRDAGCEGRTALHNSSLYEVRQLTAPVSTDVRVRQPNTVTPSSRATSSA